MNMGLTSNFASRLLKFFEQKQALGYSYRGTYYDFKAFDRMCLERFPNERELTSDICNAWATRRSNESIKTTARRLPFLREFARYLIRSGEQAYVLPKGRIKQVQRYIPHIYTHAELIKVWDAFDSIQSTKIYPAAHLVMPTFIRILYGCGLRPSEALNLKTEDADLNSGKLFIAESKGHKDRIVMLADDVLHLCRDYSERIKAYIPNRVFFFAKNSSDPCDYGWVSWMFIQIRNNLDIESNGENPPRLYDMRHTFATHRLYQWMKDGKDLYAMLPYLNAYMGHAKLTETFYYIHLVPGMFEDMSGFKFESAADIFPEVADTDE